jgi:hypothetical protein
MLTNPKIVSELTIFLMFFGILLFFIAYRIFTFSYQIVHSHMDAADACGSPAPYVGIAGKKYLLFSSF